MPRRPSSISLVLCALALASCSTTESAATAEPLPTIGLGSDLGEGVPGLGEPAEVAVEITSIVMIGDSITVASTPALEEAFGALGFDDPSIVAQQGKRIAVTFGDNPSGATVAAALVDESVGQGSDAVAGADGASGAGSVPDTDHAAELWIVALGTNDINQYGDAADRAAAINELLAAVPPESPLIWVDTYFRDQPEGATEINDSIGARLARRGNATIARWSGVAAAEGNLRDDGVHPREQGSAAFAAVVAATVADFLQLG